MSQRVRLARLRQKVDEVAVVARTDVRQSRMRRARVRRDRSVQKRLERCLIKRCAVMATFHSFRCSRCNTLSYGRGLMQRRFASGGHADAKPGAETAHRLRTSDKTVAHCTFFTSRGIIVLNSDLPSE